MDTFNRETNIETIKQRFDQVVYNFGTENSFSNSELGSFEGLTEENSFILGGSNSSNNREKVILNVNTFADQNDGSSANGLSLRDAILTAHRDLDREYIINLPAGTHTLTIQGNEDFRFQETSGTNLGLFDNILTRTGDLDIEIPITIRGADPENTIIDASNLEDRIFDVKENGFLTISNVTMQNGTALGTFEEDSEEPNDPDSFLGGGIRIALGGSAIINSSIIKENHSRWDTITDEANVNGGGIANRGFLEINDTTIIDNIADVNGGGIYNSGTMSIFSSSIVNNSANATLFYVDQIEGGGGIHNAESGTLVLENSTVSGNQTLISGNDEERFPEGAGGGGILSSGSQLIVTNSTIVNNSAPLGSGILVSQSDTTENFNPAVLQNSIVAQNNNSADIEGFFELNSSYNLIGNGNGILFNGIDNNIVGDITNPLDPQLEPLADNGGITPTHALRANSPAINAGSNDIASEVAASDQRGKRRILDGTVDIGSYEYAENQLLDTPLYRLQNTEQAGTYLFVNYKERQQILANYHQFEDEGFAFSVAFEPHDELTAMYRMQNQDLPGTYLYVNEQERDTILEDYDNFINEGLAFYVYEAGSNLGQDIYRFQNIDIPGTYLFVNKTERDAIRENYDNFIEEGIAWEAGF